MHIKKKINQEVGDPRLECRLCQKNITVLKMYDIISLKRVQEKKKGADLKLFWKIMF